MNDVTLLGSLLYTYVKSLYETGLDKKVLIGCLKIFLWHTSMNQHIQMYSVLLKEVTHNPHVTEITSKNEWMFQFWRQLMKNMIQ